MGSYTLEPIVVTGVGVLACNGIGRQAFWDALQNGASGIGMIDRFERIITVQGDDLTDDDRSKLLAIADKCPVHRTLEAASAIATVLAD